MQNEWLQSIQNMYLIFMLMLYPLIVRQGYNDIARAKLVAFFTVSLIFIIANIITIVMSRIKGNYKATIYLRREEKICLAAIIFFVIASFIKNKGFKSPIIGYYDYAESFLFITTIILVLIFLKIQIVDELKFCISACIGAIAVEIIGFTQFLQYDFGKFYSSSLNGSPVTRYMSTMSNVDCVGFYVALMFPFSCYLLTHNKLKYIGGIGIVMSAIGIIVANADSSLMGIAVEAPLLVIISRKEKSYRKISYIAIMLLGVGLTIVGLLREVLESTREINSIQSIISKPIMGITIILIGLVLVLLNEVEIVNRIAYFAACAVLLLVCLYPLYIVLYTKMVIPDENSILKNALYFDNHWGSGRGYIWKSNLYIFKESSLIDKLFGNGVSSFGKIYDQYREYLNTIYEPMYIGVYMNDSHNMFLHFMFEYGILALISVMGFLICRLRNMFKGDNYFDKIKAISLLAGMIMGTITISSCIHMAFIPLLL